MVDLSKIKQTIVKHLASRADELKGAMYKDQYFLLNSFSGDNIGREAYVVGGSAVDSLAWMIETNRFFSGWCNGTEHATNVNNGNINLLNDKPKLTGTFQYRMTKLGPIMLPIKIDQRRYLDVLRMPIGFKASAEVLGINGDLDEITEKLFSNCLDQTSPDGEVTGNVLSYGQSNLASKLKVEE